MRSDGQTDWRNAAAYARLLEADRTIFAWEWLRRNPAYRDAAEWSLVHASPDESFAEAAAWGLLAFEAPRLPAPIARPIWHAEACPLVLRAFADGEGGLDDAFDLHQFASSTTLLTDREGCEHLLLSDGLHAVRIDVVAGSAVRGPVRLSYLLSGRASVERPLLTLRRLLAFCRTGRFSRSLHPPAPRARRWVMMLRAWDALAAGAGQREIAEALLSSTAGANRWRSEAPSLRSQAQRLVRGARRMAGGGYRTLLL